MSVNNLDLAVTRMLCPEWKYNIKSTYPMTPQFIVIHNTWNTASAMDEISYMIRNNNYTSFHYAVDENQAVQGLPLNRNGWHAGDGTYGVANRNSIAIEICRSRCDLATYIQAEDNGAKLTALLLKQYGWGIDKIKYHFQFMRKHCPHRMLDENRKDIFEKNVQKYIDQLNGKLSTQNASGTVKIKATARTYATGQLIPAWVKQRTHTVLKEQADRVLLKEIYSWVNKADIEGAYTAQQHKTNEQIAQEVLNGIWGNGATRKIRLEKDGYNYDAVQAIVNRLVHGSRKTDEQVVEEVWRGLWGNGLERKERLTNAGYDYNEIQKKVNEKKS